MSLNLLCIDDDREFLIHLQLEMENHHKVTMAADVAEGMKVIKGRDIDAVLLDIGLGHTDGISALKLIKKDHPKLPVVMLTGFRDPKTIIEAIHAGATHYICKPFETEELLSVLEKIEGVGRLHDKNQALLATLNNGYSASPMVGKSLKFRQVIDQAALLKGHNANVLIGGESGTGKELLARYIHNLEDSPSRPFIAINCAAIPANLMESELFGHERGAFTSAIKRKIGKFELANGGDLFLDEISSLPLDLQAKIRRAGYEVIIRRTGTFNRVLVGNFATRGQARAERAAVKRAAGTGDEPVLVQNR